MTMLLDRPEVAEPEPVPEAPDRVADPGKAIPEPAGYADGRLVVCYDTREVWLHGRPVNVTKGEFKLLRRLCETPGRYVLLPVLRGLLPGHVTTVDEQVRVYVQRLRVVIGYDLIQTRHGVGYRLIPAGDDPRTAGVVLGDLLRALEKLPEPGETWTGSRRYLTGLALELGELLEVVP